MKKLIKDLLVLEKDLTPKTILSYKILSNITPEYINILLANPNKNKNFIATIGTTIDFGTILNNLDPTFLEEISHVITVLYGKQEYQKLELILKIYNELYYKLTEKILLHPLIQEPLHLRSIKPLASSLDDQLVAIINHLPNNNNQKQVLIELYREIKRIKVSTMNNLFATYALPTVLSGIEQNYMTLGLYGLYEYTHELAKIEANCDHNLENIYEKSANAIKFTPSNAKDDFLTTYHEVENAKQEYMSATRNLKRYLNNNYKIS